MKTEKEYADELVEQYRMRIGSRGYQNFMSVCIQCAINDVTNTINALMESLDCKPEYYKLTYYKTVLQILNERL